MLGESKMIGFVSTTDAARAQDFYEGKLGFRYVSGQGGLGGRHRVVNHAAWALPSFPLRRQNRNLLLERELRFGRSLRLR